MAETADAYIDQPENITNQFKVSSISKWNIQFVYNSYTGVIDRNDDPLHEK